MHLRDEWEVFYMILLPSPIAARGDGFMCVGVASALQLFSDCN